MCHTALRRRNMRGTRNFKRRGEVRRQLRATWIHTETIMQHGYEAKMHQRLGCGGKAPQQPTILRSAALIGAAEALRPRPTECGNF